MVVMQHTICDACEWVALCTKRQHCVPITVESPVHVHRPFRASIEEADAPVSTPEQAMTWSALAWTLTAGAGIAAVVMLAINWPVK